MIVSGSTTQPLVVEYGADWLRLPLQRPYVVAYDAIETFDVFLTRVRLSDGSVVFGEACPVPGYSSDTAASIWQGMRDLIPLMKEKDREAVARALAPYLDEQPFLVAALLTPLEWTDATAGCPAEIEVPLIGTVLGKTPDEIISDVEQLLSAGYRTIKTKVGWDVDKDLSAVAIVQRAVDDVARKLGHGDEPPKIRIDANQGYSVAQASEFLKRLDPSYVQLFEQPIGGEQWDRLRELPVGDVPLMLDEWIVDKESVDRAAAIPGVEFVKFKLMKAGGFANLVDLIEHARKLGLKVILGNGVAGDVGCLGEAIVSWRLGLELAGEMNGFLKPRQKLAPVLSARSGKLIARPFDLSIDEEVLSESRVDSIRGW